MQNTDHHSAALSSDRILQLERKKRVFLIYALSLIGSAVCLIFGIHNLSEGMNIVGVTLIVVAILAGTNLAYFFSMAVLILLLLYGKKFRPYLCPVYCI